MNKIEKLRKIVNETYCQECNDFGLCEYCEPKQTLVDIEKVLSVYEYLLISNRSDVNYEKKVKKATEAYKRLMEEDKPKEIVIEEPPMDRCCVDDGKSLFSNYRCPNCGESYFSIDYTTSTLMYCPTVIKDGKIISHDCNTTTEVCTCHNCHKKFFISHKDGKTTITGEE